ncbi:MULTISPECIES: hypothetical protein [Kitasatospora]|uniref:Uncharacterized protein n=2 Tax=Kitasatospora TaxID=2063 RepID=A0ABT1IYJ7_9ACTN|nr:hypothetical protein [Kitasatospora paracochleata]MCP2309596.1 hypothetical protein [Kitasatospora paracochleata]
MPSLRQPVGPLPASIYWRRRLVVFAALAAVLALIVWLAGGLGDGGGKKPQGSALPAPAQSITPGASPSGSAITSRPGGTGGGGSVSGGGGGDVSITTGGTSGGSSPAPGSAAGGTGSGSTGGGASGGTGGTGSTAGGTGGGTGGAPQVNTAEVMALPICSASQIALELASAQNSYQSKDRPRLALTVRNTSGANCRVDLGRTASTITVTSSSGERIWSSGDCPTDRSGTWAQITAGSGLTETFNWDRSRSKQQCASADPTAAQPGNYLVQADLTGPSGGPVSARTSIRLES